MEYIIVNSFTYDMLVANKQINGMTVVDSIAYVGYGEYHNITVFIESMLDINFVMGTVFIDDIAVARDIASLQEQTNDKHALEKMLCDKMINEFKYSGGRNMNYFNAIRLLNDIMR